MEEILEKEIDKLVERVKKKTKYQEVRTEVKLGGVYIYHPCGVLICYASISKDKLEPEIYNGDYINKIKVAEENERTKEEKLFKTVDKELEEIKQLKEQDQNPIILPDNLQINSDKEEKQDVFKEQVEKNKKQKIKIKREKKKNLMEIILCTLATLVLATYGIKKGISTIEANKENKQIEDYVGEDTNITQENRNENSTNDFENAKIASAIEQTNKNPWAMLTDVLKDMNSSREKNFPIVVDKLFSLGYFEFNFEQLSILANARKIDGTCDYKKLIAYMRERAVFAITQEQLQNMAFEEKKDLASFLVEFNATVGELSTDKSANKKLG